ncbi:MAG: hypothetical protein CUN57_03900, partial [Phototrophicales bacterium]
QPASVLQQTWEHEGGEVFMGFWGQCSIRTRDLVTVIRPLPVTKDDNCLVIDLACFVFAVHL